MTWVTGMKTRQSRMIAGFLALAAGLMIPHILKWGTLGETYILRDRKQSISFVLVKFELPNRQAGDDMQKAVVFAHLELSKRSS